YYSTLRVRSFLCFFFFYRLSDPRSLHSFPTRRSSDLLACDRAPRWRCRHAEAACRACSGRGVHASASGGDASPCRRSRAGDASRSEEHTSELQSLAYLVCRLLLEKKKEPRIISTA